MMTLIDHTNRHQYCEIMDAAYRLRHEVFVEEMRWEDIRRDDGREIDQFDTPDAIEMIVQRDGKVVGYQRLLPTTAPYLLSEIYPQLCDGAVPRDAAIFEWTRFAVAKQYRGDGRSLGPVALDLVTAFVEWGLAAGIRSLVVEMTPIQLLRFVLCQFRPYPLGVSQTINGEEVVAILAAFDERTLARLRSFRGDDRPVLDDTRQRAALAT